MRKRGFIFLKQHWYSICSVHSLFEKDCQACNKGRWYYIWEIKFEQFFSKHFYKLWLFWVNRPKSKDNNDLQTWFPNLRGNGQSNFSYFLNLLKKKK